MEKKAEVNDQSKLFLVTDGCMWEQNKKGKTFYPHAIEVVDVETGELRFIRSGSRIQFVDGNITVGRNQDLYNEKS